MKILRSIATAPETITFVLLVIALSVSSGMDARYLLDKTSDFMPVCFMALAMTFVIIAGQIDLSVASGSLLVAVACASLFSYGVPMFWIIPLAFVFGSLLGLFNGILVAYLNLPSLVVTLGTLALYRGLAQGWIGAATIRGFPKWFVGINDVKLATIPLPVIIFLMVAAGLAAVLLRSTFGRRVIALGTNPSATRYSAVNTARVNLSVFVLSGLSMGAAALLEMSQIGSIDQRRFNAFELLAITAVVLGGTSIFGGQGGILGTVLALLLLVVVRSAMGVADVLPQIQLVVVGSLLIGSVLITNLIVRIHNLMARIHLKFSNRTRGVSHA